MAALTEYTLFKQCVDTPIKLTDTAALQLQFVRDPAQPHQSESKSDLHDGQKEQPEDSKESQARKQLLLYQMIWRGITKYVWQMIHNQGRAVEIPQLSMALGPQFDQWAQLSNPLQKGPLTKNPQKQLQFFKTVSLAVEDLFVQATCITLD